ncbi:MAG: putative Ig domain-containing protein [Syntrophomonadaceae bacterium]|nr:putative Ig domain-containing protein [Syntrophomonadaceae bacterium]
MKRIFRPIILLTIFIVSLFVIPTVLFAVKPGTTWADNSINDMLTNLSDSSPGKLTVTWYNAERTKLLGSIFDVQNGALDQQKTEDAFRNLDRSSVVRTDYISSLDFDIPVSDNNTWVWGEVSGFIKVPEYGVLKIEPTIGTAMNYVILVDGEELINKWATTEPTIYYTSFIPRQTFNKGEYVPFTIRIGSFNLSTDQCKGFSFKVLCVPVVNTPEGSAYNLFGISYLTTNHFYAHLSLKDMQNFFKFDSANYTLTLDSKYPFPVDEYEYGVLGGTNFKTLKLGTNYIDPDTGDVIVRYKAYPNLYITLGSISLPKVSDLKVTRRTTGTASLSWSAPSGSTPTGYDIYRQIVDVSDKFSPTPVVRVEQPWKVGSTTGLTFTDQGLGYDLIYQYYVKAQYSTGYSHQSDTVRTDSVSTEGVPPAPTDLRVSDQTQTSVSLQWGVSAPESGLKEYIVYRKRIPVQTIQTLSDGTILLAMPADGTLREIGRSKTARYVDSGLSLFDTCEYAVQAVDNNGIPFFITSSREVYFKDLTPPTAPGNFQAGEVLRPGNTVLYNFPSDSGIRNVFLGPKREVALRWQPSTDNVGVVGYNIFRSAYSPVSSRDGLVGSLIPKKPVGSTQDTFFVDSGLEFGTTYTYYIGALDAAGNASTNTLQIGTEESGLAGLTIANGSQILTPDPAFVYCETAYQLDVDNTVDSITLTTEKIDSQATVTVNGVQTAEDGSIGPLNLEPGENIINIDVVPRTGYQHLVKSQTMRYTLTVNRANRDSLPVLTLPESGTLPDGVSTYRAAGRLDVQNDRVWTGTADYGDGSEETPLQLTADGSFSLEHNYLGNGQYMINVEFKYEDLGLVKGHLELTVRNAAPARAAAVPIVTTTTLPNSTAGSSYSATLKADGDTSVIWSIDSGSLPDGLSLDERTGVISGTPISEGTYTFTIKATNAADSK